MGAASSPYTISYSYPGDSNYASNSATTTLTVNKATPIINWTAPGSINYGTPLGGLQLGATITAPDNTYGAVTYSPPSGTVLNAGVGQTLTVNVAATSNYNAATLSVPITVNKLNPTISWATPNDIAYGTALGSTQLDASVSVPGPDPTIGTITYVPPVGTVLSPGLGQTLTVNVAATTNYNAATDSVPINVKLQPVFDTLSQPVITYGTAMTTPLGTHRRREQHSHGPRAEVTLNGVNQFRLDRSEHGGFLLGLQHRHAGMRRARRTRSASITRAIRPTRRPKHLDPDGQQGDPVASPGFPPIPSCMARR